MLHAGRKEIMLFFYIYALIELLAIFLDSNIIPTANVSYPVRTGVFILQSDLDDRSVVRRCIYRPRCCSLHMFAHQRFRRIPIR